MGGAREEAGGDEKTVTHEGQPQTAWNVKQRVLDCFQTVFIGVMSANMVIWSWGRWPARRWRAEQQLTLHCILDIR